MTGKITNLLVADTREQSAQTKNMEVYHHPDLICFALVLLLFFLIVFTKPPSCKDLDYIIF